MRLSCQNRPRSRETHTSRLSRRKSQLVEAPVVTQAPSRLNSQPCLQVA